MGTPTEAPPAPHPIGWLAVVPPPLFVALTFAVAIVALSVTAITSPTSGVTPNARIMHYQYLVDFTAPERTVLTPLTALPTRSPLATNTMIASSGTAGALAVMPTPMATPTAAPGTIPTALPASRDRALSGPIRVVRPLATTPVTTTTAATTATVIPSSTLTVYAQTFGPDGATGAVARVAVFASRDGTIYTPIAEFSATQGTWTRWDGVGAYQFVQVQVSKAGPIRTDDVDADRVIVLIEASDRPADAACPALSWCGLTRR